MKMRIFEMVFKNRVSELFFDGLMKRSDFELILGEFTAIKGVKIIREFEDPDQRACLLSNGEFEIVLVYSSDVFIWNYAYSVKSENHDTLKKLCRSFAEVIDKR